MWTVWSSSVLTGCRYSIRHWIIFNICCWFFSLLQTHSGINKCVKGHLLIYISLPIKQQALSATPFWVSLIAAAFLDTHWKLHISFYWQLQKYIWKVSCWRQRHSSFWGDTGSTDLQLVLGMQIKLEVLSRLGPCVCISRTHCSRFQLVPNWNWKFSTFLPFFFLWASILSSKAQTNSVGPLMAGARLTLLRLALKARKLPQREVGNWSFDVLYVFLLISRNSLMFILI